MANAAGSIRPRFNVPGWSGLILRVARLLLSTHGLETIPAIDRFVRARQERHLGCAAAIRADRWIELARPGRIAAVPPTIVAVSAAFIPATRRVAIGFSFCPARCTSHGRRKATLGIERLLSCCKNKLLSAIAAGECLITHSARTLLPWRSTTDGKRTHTTPRANRRSDAARRNPVLAYSFGSVTIFLSHYLRKVNYPRQNDGFSGLIYYFWPIAGADVRFIESEASPF